MYSYDPGMEGDPLEFGREMVFTVTQVTARIKSLFDEESDFLDISVRGEVTNLSASKAGHIYFGLKDASSYIKCVAFKTSAERLKVRPEEGREVIARGRIGVWPAGGSYQLYVDELEDIGKGALWLQFEETRKKLQAEGLFEEDIKRPLPAFPRLIGIVTSRTGAVLRDMLRIFAERAPYVRCILSPSLVQGETAPASLIAALDLLEMWDSIELEAGRTGLDLIIIGRGGGSFEDLACFNDEDLVRRIRKTRVPVISAVGHEVDFTIIDFAADVRAATPTQAAAIAAPATEDLKLSILTLISEFRQAAEIKVETYRTGILNLLSRPVFRRPLDRINACHQNLDIVSSRITRAISRRLSDLRHRLTSVRNRLEALDPTAILARGYSLAFARETGGLVSKVGQASPGMEVDLRVSDGVIGLTVDEEKKPK
jgi:exodeoxyribonuclease VII large subunit